MRHAPSLAARSGNWLAGLEESVGAAPYCRSCEQTYSPAEVYIDSIVAPSPAMRRSPARDGSAEYLWRPSIWTLPCLSALQST